MCSGFVQHFFFASPSPDAIAAQHIRTKKINATNLMSMENIGKVAIKRFKQQVATVFELGNFTEIID
jgi:hypothetical protein